MSCGLSVGHLTALHCRPAAACPQPLAVTALPAGGSRKLTKAKSATCAIFIFTSMASMCCFQTDSSFSDDLQDCSCCDKRLRDLSDVTAAEKDGIRPSYPSASPCTRGLPRSFNSSTQLTSVTWRWLALLKPPCWIYVNRPKRTHVWISRSRTPGDQVETAALALSVPTRHKHAHVDRAAPWAYSQPGSARA